MLPLTVINWVISNPERAYLLSVEVITEHTNSHLGEKNNFFMERYGESPWWEPEQGIYIVVKTPTKSDNIMIGSEKSNFEIDNGKNKYQFFKLEENI